jgi:hypothetical protein
MMQSVNCQKKSNPKLRTETQWETWFQRNPRSRQTQAGNDANGVPASVGNDDFTYVLPPGFSLLQDNQQQPAADSTPALVAPAVGAELLTGAEDRTLDAQVWRQMHTAMCISLTCQGLA